MGSFDIMELDGMKFKQTRRKNGRRSRHSNSSSFTLTLILSITTVITFILCLIIVLFSSFIHSMNFLLIFELISNIYNQIFTPLYLFFLLNLLIISIFAMTHLRSEAPRASSPHHRLSSSAGFEHEIQRFRATDAEDEARFAGIKLNDHDTAAYSLTSSVEKVQDLPTSLQSDRLCRRGDREVNRANSSDFMHSHEISAAQLLTAAESDSADVGKKVPDYCSADSDPYNQVNPGVIKEVISEGKVQINVAEMLNEGPAAQKSIKAEFYNNDDPEENEKAADPLIISKQKLLLYPEEALVNLGRERPLASSHFIHKKATRMHGDMLRSNSPLKISRPSVKRGDTLDATWKAICENKLRHSSPHSRHHIASHTWKGEHHVNVKKMGATNKSKGSLSPLSPSKEKHHMPTSPSSGLMKKRELSIPRDELNARVESFISRFNQQIRIQREQSLLNYTNMVNRGAG